MLRYSSNDGYKMPIIKRGWGIKMNGKRGKTCCFTGHRDMPLDELLNIKENLKKVLIYYINQGYVYFGAGGALGFDSLAAMTVLELRDQYPQIKLILVLPCKNQTRGWPKKDVEKYKWIMEEADKAKYTSEHYYDGCMQARNRHLVAYSSLCICYLTKNKGGTAYTVNYAKKNGLKVVNVGKYI